MKIRYVNNVEDLEYLGNHHHLKTTRRAKLQVGIIVWGMGLFVGAQHALEKSSLPLFIVWVPMLCGLTMLVTAFVGWSIRRSVRRFAQENRKAFEGEHDLEITDFELVERSPQGEMRSSLQGIEKIVKSDGYLLIYVTSMAAHVVPLNRVVEGNFQQFQAALEDRVAAAKTTSNQSPS